MAATAAPAPGSDGYPLGPDSTPQPGALLPDSLRWLWRDFPK